VSKWWDQPARTVATVIQDTAWAKVTYRGEDGSKFRVVVHQKPNPIGFNARLPGDKPHEAGAGSLGSEYATSVSNLNAAIRSSHE